MTIFDYMPLWTPLLFLIIGFGFVVFFFGGKDQDDENEEGTSEPISPIYKIGIAVAVSLAGIYLSPIIFVVGIILGIIALIVTKYSKE